MLNLLLALLTCNNNIDVVCVREIENKFDIDASRWRSRKLVADGRTQVSLFQLTSARKYLSRYTDHVIFPCFWSLRSILSFVPSTMYVQMSTISTMANKWCSGWNIKAHWHKLVKLFPIFSFQFGIIMRWPSIIKQFILESIFVESKTSSLWWKAFSILRCLPSWQNAEEEQPSTIQPRQLVAADSLRGMTSKRCFSLNFSIYSYSLVF